MQNLGLSSWISRNNPHYEQARQRLLEDDAAQAPGDQDCCNVDEKQPFPNRHVQAKNTAWVTKLVAVAACASILLALWIYSAMLFYSEKRCESGEHPAIRREWRSLTPDQRRGYIAALQCLRETPSHIHPNQPQITRWDDFAWTHYHVGFIAHNAACFLSWHRWFIALFESSLRNECMYSGPMPYWDWTLDWERPELAPVFDEYLGFGGNGDMTLPSTVDHSWCVESGPFAGARIPFDYDAKAGEAILFDARGRNTSFCLSRRFTLGSSFNASHLNPDYVSWVLSQDSYIKFLIELEDGPHNDIPFGINGTFLTLYAPEDPIFFLHHLQLDRLWWSWQKSKSENMRAYNGPSTSKTTTAARLSDLLPFGDLSDDIRVLEIVDTEQGRLCYRYDKIAT